MQPNNPDLLPVGASQDGAAHAVPALKSITKPIEQHEALKPVYFKASIVNCSMHRTDGKRLPFINGFFKATIQEDIDFLKNEIRIGNIYISEATPDEVNMARSMEDPLGVIRESMKEDVKAEVLGELSLDALEALLAEKKRAAAVVQPDPVAKAAPVLPARAAQAAAAAQALLQKAQTHASATGANTGTVGGAAASSGK